MQLRSTHNRAFAAFATVFALGLVSLSAVLCAPLSLPVFRLVQYTDTASSTTPVGSQRASFGLLATTLNPAAAFVRRSVFVVDIAAASSADAVVDAVLAHDAVILLIPESSGVGSTADASGLAIASQVLHHLAHHPNVTAAVYVAHNTAEWQPLLAQLRDNPTAMDHYLAVSAAEPAPIKDFAPVSFQGWLNGVGGIHDKESHPTIAFVANYDSFAPVPELAFGVDSNGSGAVAVLELARIFHSLYRTSQVPSKYNILFLLTTGGSFNFVSARNWLQVADHRLLESIDFVLSLDTIATPKDELYLHVSKKPSDTNAEALYESFVATANFMNIPFSIVHKKINVSDSNVAWEHEQFSRKRLVSATLSSRDSAPEFLQRSNVFDTLNTIDIKILARNIKFVGESIAHFIYSVPSPSSEILAGASRVNEDFITSWIDVFARTPRVMQYIPKKSDFVDGLEKALSHFTDEVTRIPLRYDNEYVFYGPSKSTVTIFRVKPLSFDLFLALIVAAYLVGLSMFFQNDPISKQIADLFSSKNKKATKSQK